MRVLLVQLHPIHPFESQESGWKRVSRLHLVEKCESPKRAGNRRLRVLPMLSTRESVHSQRENRGEKLLLQMPSSEIGFKLNGLQPVRTRRLGLQAVQKLPNVYGMRG